MTQLICECPVCHGEMRISSLECGDCGMKIKHNFPIDMFNRLSAEQYDFLLIFLQNRGNLKDVQEKLQISYPTAKKKLNDLLVELNLCEDVEEVSGVIDMRFFKADATSSKASEIIKTKLKENGGVVTVHTARGLPCKIYAHEDGTTFGSDKLPVAVSAQYSYEVFDTIVRLLQANGGRAPKGNGRNYKFGEGQCTEQTVVGAVAKWRGHKYGDSVYDPVFVLAAVLEWAGIAENGRGELILTEEYRKRIGR